MRLVRAVVLIAVVCFALLSLAQLTPQQTAAIDQAATEALAETGTPSASIAVVKDGKIVYTHAYGEAKLEGQVLAKPEMRYSIGSNSKQFTATAILMLAEQHKLSIDDKLAKFFPDLTRAKDITLRELLTMTAGYQDYWPQDYVMPGMLKPAGPREILDGWARKPLDYEPGTKWQYSNTNYVILGEIVKKVSGKDVFDFLREHVFTPLAMSSVADVDKAALPASDPTGYYRFALGPLHPAPKEGPGWLAAAGELAMTASDLAKWDIAMIDQKLLTPVSYKEQQTATLLKNGVAVSYGFGLSISAPGGRRQLTHGGEVSGFTSTNNIYPDDHAAIVVLTNQDAVGTPDMIADGISKVLFAVTDATAQAATDRAKQIFLGLQQGKIDRAQFTDNANYYFSETALKDFQSSLGPLGAPKVFQALGPKRERGGMTTRAWMVEAGDKHLRVWTYELPDGKLEQYQIAPAD